jgi:hypothetical protein
VTRRAHGRLGAGIRAVVAVAAGLLLWAGAPAPPPAAASPGPPAASGSRVPTQERPPLGAGALSIRITDFAPVVPGPDDTLVVRGTITSTATVPVADVRAVLRISATPLSSRVEIPEVLGGLGDRTGEPVADALADVAAVLVPGASAPFALEAPVADLGLADAGVYVTGVEALGSTGSGAVRQDLDRTFLPWWPPDATAAPLLLTTLWPLGAPPAQDVTGVLLDDAVPLAMSPGGRLATLLDAVAGEPGAATPVVDPLAVQLAADAADGYEVLGADGAPATGTRAGEVAAWLEALRDVVSARPSEAVAMLYGGADVMAARTGRLLTTLLRQRPLIDDTTRAALGVDLPQRLVMVPGGSADEPALRALVRAGAGAVVLADTAVPVSRATFFTPSGNLRVSTRAGDLPVLVTDSGLAAALAMPLASPDQVAAARQRLLAETLTTVTELPETQRLLVMAPDPGWTPSAQGAAMVLDVLSGTPWVDPTSLAEALAREPSSVVRTLAPYGPEQRAAELPAAHVRQVRGQYLGLRAYGDVISAAADLDGLARTAPSRGLSGWLRSDPVLRQGLTARVSQQVAALSTSVRIVSEGSITVSGASGTIPVTVENTGPVPVTLGLTMTSSPPQLFVAEPVEPFRIDPQRRTSVEVIAQVAAAGPVPVRIQLTSADGRPFGEPGQLTVQSSAYANAAGILVRAALAALLLAVVVHGVRRARRRRRAPSPPATDPEAAEVVRG